MSARPVILFYNRFFEEEPDLESLPERDRDFFTSDIGRFAEADAVVFHIPSLPHLRALRKPVGQLWVLWSMESVVNYPCMADPAFLRFFDLTMTYERKADIWMPYIPDRQTWDRALRLPPPKKTEAAPAVMFQSSNADQSGRNAYVAELMKYMKIDSYGKIHNNRSLTEEDRGWPTKLAVVGRYKFCISMENSIAEDYVTEKLFQPMLAGTVPVYLGAPNVERFAPGYASYVNAADFSGPKALAEYLNALSVNEDAYGRLFAWRSRSLNPLFARDLDRPGPVLANLLQTVRARVVGESGSRKLAKSLVRFASSLVPAKMMKASFYFDPRFAGPFAPVPRRRTH